VVRANIYRPGGEPIIGVGAFDNPSEFPDHSRFGNESGAYNFVAQAVEVEVDPDSGQVKLVEIASAVDCGTVIHPGMAEGQVHGAVTQGIGLAMVEYFDWYNGAPTNPQLVDYPIPSAMMMPKQHVAFADSYEPSGPFGAKGIGEIGLDAIPAAIANAIADAVGVRITRLPITAEKIHRALHPEAYAGEAPPKPQAPRGTAATRLAAGRPSGPRRARPELLFPASVEEAVARYAEGDAALVCGGTSHASRRERGGYPFARRLIALNRIPELQSHSVDTNGTLRAGAAVALETLHQDARVRRAWPAIADAFDAVGATRIRRMITVGGSVGPLIAGFDLPLALLALGARVHVAGPDGRRCVALQALFEKRLGKGEIVIGIEVDPKSGSDHVFSADPKPDPKPGSDHVFSAKTWSDPNFSIGSAFFKFMPRGVLEIPTVTSAALVQVDAAGRCTQARVAVGAVAPAPIVREPAQLAGALLTIERAREAVRDVAAAAQPLTDVRGSVAYKRAMAVEFAARALMRAWERARERRREG
jgi:CO/xanthine dehydrogenase FAD-binding subunit